MPTAFPRCVLATLLCAPFLAAAQAPVPTAAQVPPAPPDPAATLHVQTNLVVVDVIVTDSHQNPVHNLTQADFDLKEDGHPQAIKSFEEHTAEQAATPSQAPPPSRDPGAFTNEFDLPSTGPLNLILLDHLNTPERDQANSVDQVAQYLKTAPAGARFAILALTSTQMYLVQGFTTDHDLLLAALNSKKVATSYPVYLTGPTDSSPTGPSGVNPATAAKRETRRQLTLDSLNQLGRYLGQLPGRKNLLWFASSFPIAILPNGEAPENLRPAYIEEFRETVNLLAHNQVAVYPIDTRGLTAEPLFTSTNANSSGGGRSNPLVPSQNDAFYTANADRRAAMQDIADATGGQAFSNNNSLKQSAARAVEGGSNYYTLAYTPSSDKWKGQYRKIQIDLARKGYTLAYRRGYYATDPNAPVEQSKSTAEQKDASSPAKTDTPEPAPYSAMQAAMVYGGPEPRQILFETIVRPSIAQEEPAAYPHNQPSAAAKGPFRRYNVHYKAHLDDIHCSPTPQGPLYCAVEFVTCVYDADGLLINTQVNDIKEMVKPDFFASVHRTGNHPEFQYKQEISVPAKGDYFLRVGVHDLLTNHVGAVELPVSAVSNLPPLTAAGSAPPPAAK
ncbi:MAG: VWA domain-containing protein [Terracidiphilus sp.]|jgi:VWFA-related protein